MHCPTHFTETLYPRTSKIKSVVDTIIGEEAAKRRADQRRSTLYTDPSDRGLHAVAGEASPSEQAFKRQCRERKSGVVQPSKLSHAEREMQKRLNSEYLGFLSQQEIRKVIKRHGRKRGIFFSPQTTRSSQKTLPAAEPEQCKSPERTPKARRQKSADPHSKHKWVKLYAEVQNQNSIGSVRLNTSIKKETATSRQETEVLASQFEPALHRFLSKPSTQRNR